jgi:hypothetical protein
MTSHSDDGLREFAKERAAIREYCGGMAREDANYRALRDVRKEFGELPLWLVKEVLGDRMDDAGRDT